ncbi:hypothetical protein [Streptomyces sp. NBC_01264]|uniref:hypothetical protein n=1 Tax=Streptomyces sp. NBC_01264 TaxID=2903804 RepID=UPI0022549F3F|nr:hypothetical protein [Streptomyces sp. NBC_01264]MCX4783351.1 hypothetical protein [Streptomyces sp. NBC_01264]
MNHQRFVQHVRPDGGRQIGQLVSRPAFDDEFARWLITPMATGGVLWQRVRWADVEAGQFFSAAAGDLTEEQQRTLARWLRGYLDRE